MNMIIRSNVNEWVVTALEYTERMWTIASIGTIKRNVRDF